MQIALATYNIHAGIGVDGIFNPARIVAVLRELNCNIVALQEVEHHEVGERDMLDYLAAETGFTAIAGPTLLRKRRHYGNALLTNFPVLALHRIDLSIADREPRGALDVTIDCHGQTLQIIATHLGLNPKERRHQIRQLLTHLESPSAEVSVLMGDLNEWFLWGRMLRWLRAHFQPTPSLATFPARWPLLALDHIWVMPRQRLVRLERHTSRLARVASDHLPLRAVIEI